MEKPNNFKNILMGTILFWAAITLLLFIRTTTNPCDSVDCTYKPYVKK